MRGQGHTVANTSGSVVVFDELTVTEARILEFVAQGLSTKEIASMRWVSSQAVTYHIGHLLLKFDATNRAGLVARSYVSGTLLPGAWPPRVNEHVVRGG